jgi:hypothetical protein
MEIRARSVEKHFQERFAELRIPSAALGMTKGRATLPCRVVAEQKSFSSTWAGHRPIDHSGPTASGQVG